VTAFFSDTGKKVIVDDRGIIIRSPAMSADAALSLDIYP
jgi:hypothetical protein